MIFRNKLDDDVIIDEVIRLSEELANSSPETEKYRTLVDRIDQLYRIRRENLKTNSVSKDTIAVVSTNLLGILLILNFEKLNMITSKAMSFVIKGRV